MFLVGLLLILVMLFLMLVPLAQGAWAAYRVSQDMVYCYPLGANLVDRGAGSSLRARHKPHRRSYHGFHHDTDDDDLEIVEDFGAGDDSGSSDFGGGDYGDGGGDFEGGSDSGSS
jgi:hypothetical protein